MNDPHTQNSPEDESASPRTRAPRVPRAVRRAQLLSAAHHVFVERGYHGASMDEIAEMANVSKPVVYQHFNGKQDLYLDLLDHHLGKMGQLLEAALDTTPGMDDRIHATVRAYFTFMHNERRAYRLIFESDVQADPEVAARLDAFQQRFTKAIVRHIVQDASLSFEEAELLARGLAGAAEVTARTWVQQDEERRVPLERAVELVADLARRGIPRTLPAAH